MRQGTTYDASTPSPIYRFLVCILAQDCTSTVPTLHEGVRALSLYVILRRITTGVPEYCTCIDFLHPRRRNVRSDFNGDFGSGSRPMSRGRQTNSRYTTAIWKNTNPYRYRRYLFLAPFSECQVSSTDSHLYGRGDFAHSFGTPQLIFFV